MGDVKESESEMREVEKGKEDLVMVMDTPDRSKAQIGTPVSKFEESPVFNFLNNLSPIKTSKSASITQTLNALSFASLPSVFTSPHVSSLKESRFLRRHQDLDPSKPEFSADNTENKIMMDREMTSMICNGNEQRQVTDPKNSGAEVSLEMSLECSKPPGNGFVQSLNFDCTSPVCQTNTICSSEYMSFSDFAANSREIVPFSHVASGNGVFGNEACREEEENMGDGSGGATGCDWEAILSFDSPMDADTLKKSLGSDTDFYNNSTNDLPDAQPLRSIRPGEDNETNNASTQPGEGGYTEELAEMQEMLADSCLDTNYMDEHKLNGESVSHLYRGVRRRCLVFEMSGARRKRLEENSSSVSPILTQPEGNAPTNGKQLVSMRITNDSKCILPGIGLHLNALATTPKEHKGIKQDASASNRLVIGPNSTSNFHSLQAGQEPFNQSLVMASTERDISNENGLLLLEDAGQSSVNVENEELNRNSPKKKRRRLEQAVEGESSCKRCNCKKSKCLKLYCECFAAGVYCVEPCSCQDCFNKPIHEETVLLTRKQIETRNPMAFQPKVIRNSDSQAEAGDDSSMTPASARHKRGCNCKKSGCLKKYCECYQGGVGCSVNCRCDRCKNAYGRKDNSALVGVETEQEEDEMEASEERSSQKAAIQADRDHNAESVLLPATPSRFKRSSSAQPPFSSKRRPPRSSTSSAATTTVMMTTTTVTMTSSSLLGRPNFQQPQPQPQPKFDNMQFEMFSQDEMPEILLLQGNNSPLASGIIKSSSPNSKRVSPPHTESGGMSASSASPNRRSSRKLILQSIPSFPNLTPNKHN